MRRRKRAKETGTPPGTPFIRGIGMSVLQNVKVDPEEEKRIEIFCKHPKWSVVLLEISEALSDYERITKDLAEYGPRFPLEVGAFRLEIQYGRGRHFVLFRDDTAIYDFDYNVQRLPDAEEDESQGADLSFYGAKGQGKPAKFGLLTKVYEVAWDEVFCLEQFEDEIQNLVPDLESRLEDQKAQNEESAKEFEDFVEGAGTLLKHE